MISLFCLIGSGAYSQSFPKPSPLNLMVKHCGECHWSEQRTTYPPSYLNGSERQALRSIMPLREKMIDFISNKIMPPDIDLQNALEKSGDKEKILNFLKSLKP